MSIPRWGLPAGNPAMTQLNFLLVGAAKAGTTDLATFLGRHPRVFMSRNKEPMFFALEGRPSNSPAPGRPSEEDGSKRVGALASVILGGEERYCGGGSLRLVPLVRGSPRSDSAEAARGSDPVHPASPRSAGLFRIPPSCSASAGEKALVDSRRGKPVRGDAMTDRVDDPVSEERDCQRRHAADRGKTERPGKAGWVGA